MPRPKPEHEIRSLALARISCVCGWFWRNEYLKGKADCELAAEAEFEFKRHQDEMDAHGY